MKTHIVLIVDDQSINRAVLNKILQDEYVVLQAENGEQAMRILNENAEKVSAVLLDIVMPVMDGYAVLKAMSEDERLNKIPVIVSSLLDGEHSEVKALSLGAQDFIAKPYKPDIIRHRLNNLIRFRETAAIVNRAERDELTGLLTKQFFLEKVAERMRENPDEKYDILCFNIAGFKLVNDTYGKEIGDKLLKHIATLLDESGALFSTRFTSDHFYQLIARPIVNQDGILKEYYDKVHRFPIEISFGINCGVYPVQKGDKDVLAMCDRAKLAADTNRGRANELYSVYDDTIRKKMLEEQFIVGCMQTAIETEQFQVYYQPKYDLHTEMVAGAEALVRWNHPEKGMMQPGKFIPLFEKNGFITTLDRYVWERACKDLRHWADIGLPLVPVSVNVSRADIFNPRLPEILNSLVEKYQIPLAYLHLEITESAYTDNPERIIEAVRTLHDMGFVIEMDDFGSGYSSLNMLAELPVDVLKLDMRFVQNEVKHASGRGIMSFVISLAKWMRLSVIAEGVETAEQITTLRSMDCNFVQGYYYAKPMPDPDFEKTLKTVSVLALEEIPKSGNANAKEKGRTLLIVDDVEVNRHVLSSIFCDEYDIVEKENGEEALLYLQANFKKVEVVLLDLLMPVMDGFQLLKRMKENEFLQNIPVVVASQGDVNAEEKALELGADDFISKPYNPRIVFHRVHNVVQIYHTENLKEKELTLVKKREQTLMDSIPGGVAIYHVKKDGRITTEYVSDGFARLCGYTAEEYLSLVKIDAKVNVFSGDLPHLTSVLRENIAKNIPIHEIQHFRTKGGKWIPVRLDANVISEGDLEEDDSAILYAVHTKMAEEIDCALLEQNRYRYILDNLDVAYFEVDDKGKLYASDKYFFYEISGEKIEDIVNNSGLYSGVHPEDLPKLFEFFNQKQKKMPKTSVTLRLKMKDGSYRWTEMMGFFDYDESGKSVRTIGTLRDVDNEWQNQNRKLQAALDYAEKANASKTDFLARISHEMRTPLNGILGLCELLADKEEDTQSSRELEELRQSGRYLLQLIDDTLDVSTIEQGKMQLHPVVCDGKSTLENVFSMIRPNIKEKNLKFGIHADGLPFTKLYIDAGRVQQAVMNILLNAIKFTPEGGTVDFYMENVSVEEGVITDKIIVKDTGIGMSEDFVKHIFEPFSQEHNDVHSVYRGAGLGMSISKQCVELMGGKITVESKQNAGTTVTVLLPMKIATKEQLDIWHTAQSVADYEILKGKRILLCEDHPLNAEIAIRLLQKRGMIVDHAENGKIGLNAFAASSVGYYDAVLMDIRMPVMDGMEATRQIRSLKRRSDALSVPIIAMTANTLDGDVRNSLNAGMSEHLGKPVEPEKLFSTLVRFISNPLPFAGKKILVVDDVETNRELVRLAISKLFTVFEAGSGEEAVEVLEREQDIAGVITDIQMPGMDGKALISWMRARKKYDGVAILANTIYGDHRQEEELLALGANDFVYKPSSAQILLMRLQYILRYL